MTITSRGFTLIEILVALVISAMGIVAIAQFVVGASRAQSAATALETAAMLADQAIECALLPAKVATSSLQEATAQAQALGWRLTIARNAAPFPGVEEVKVSVSGPDLPRPIELSRLTRHHPAQTGSR